MAVERTLNCLNIRATLIKRPHDLSVSVTEKVKLVICLNLLEHTINLDLSFLQRFSNFNPILVQDNASCVV